MEQKLMAESDRDGPSAGWRRVRIVALSLALFFLTTLALGFVIAVLHRGEELTTTRGIAFAIVAVALLGCGWLLVRQIRTLRADDPLTPQERLNRNILIFAGVLGGVLSVVMSLVVEGGSGAISNEPLPPAAAIFLILVVGVVVPAMSLDWHRIIDEQEADATKTGALFGVYTYGIGAPVWWLAWRGGFVPPPDGFIIYFATLGVMAAVWLWKKYR